MPDDFTSLPIIDVASLETGGAAKQRTAAEINAACRQSGFFYAVGHSVDAGLQQRLQELSREFFSLPTAEKMQIEMSRAGKAWRGFFRVGDELTSGRPDQKEGLYFGTELAEDHPLVQIGTPLHGPNLFPETPVDLRETVLKYMAALTELLCDEAYLLSVVVCLFPWIRRQQNDSSSATRRAGGVDCNHRAMAGFVQRMVRPRCQRDCARQASIPSIVR